MTYRVDLTARATRDLDLLYVEKHAAESPASASWYNRLEKSVYSLEHAPHRCPVAPERQKSGRPLRHLLYGKKPDIYRVIYEIDEVRRLVSVLAIRHGAREPAELDG
jgi:toxin ParE1/3/4